MDIVAHTLWAAAGAALVHRRRPLSRGTVVLTLALWAVRRTFWVPLLGWWLHIVIDVFTHSADYYAVPVLYPFTQRGFDGIAWITPWFMALNYAALAAAGVWLLMRRKRQDRGE